MREPGAPPVGISIQQPISRWARTVAFGAFGIGLALIMLLVAADSPILIFVPAILLAVPLLILATQYPVLHVSLILGAFVLAANSEPGIQLTEALYAAALYPYLLYWYTTRIFIYREKIVQNVPDLALCVFAALVFFATCFGIIFGADLGMAFGELVALSMLGLYFPVKETVLRYRNGMKAVLLVFVWLTLVVAFRNFIEYSTALSAAEQLWQITTGRVYTNESFFMVGSIGGVIALIFARGWLHRAAAAVFLGIAAGAMLLTLSRGVWLSFLVGAFVIFLVVEARRKVQMAVAGAISIGGILIIGTLFFQDYMQLVGIGLVDRFESVQDAAVADVSLVNRFVESQAVRERIWQNPVVGYGPGVTFDFFDLTHKATREDAFVHNAYYGLWYKFGIFGLISMMVVWLGTIWHSYSAFRLSDASLLFRCAGLFVAGSLVAFLVAAYPANPFLLIDKVFVVSLLFALGSALSDPGLRQHARGV